MTPLDSLDQPTALPGGSLRRARRGEGDAGLLSPSLLSHELRAPLASVHSALSLLQERLGGKLGREELDILSLALKNTERLSGLIDDILDYSKLQAGKMALALEATSPRAVIQESMDSLKAWSLTRGVKLLRAPESEPLSRVLADPKRVVQVLTNLLSNAVKFTQAGGKVEISAAAGRHEHAGTVVFSVKDTGCGIPPLALERLFRPFEQAARAAAPRGPCPPGSDWDRGTGIGLALAKSMVEMQGGRIWAESWRGLGSTFRFSLPIHPRDLPRPMRVYPQPIRYHGLLISVFRRLNVFLSYFV